MMKSQALQVIADCVSKCTTCNELTTYRDENKYKTVPGVGNPNADLFCLGEAPGEDEALSGEPFVGRAGKLLTSILEAAGFRREDVFIANILKCRPPQNRVPTNEEAKNCRKFLDLQLKCVNPKWILCLGKTATVHLLGKPEDATMGSLRGVHQFGPYKVVATYHPSYLLRTPTAKQEVWKDIQPILQELKPTN